VLLIAKIINEIRFRGKGMKDDCGPLVDWYWRRKIELFGVSPRGRIYPEKRLGTRRCSEYSTSWSTGDPPNQNAIAASAPGNRTPAWWPVWGSSSIPRTRQQNSFDINIYIYNVQS
jgi:hypothetical protein